MNTYIYEGPVIEFGKLVQERWNGKTIASSEKKAKNNLAYQWKRKNNRTPMTKISLPGNLFVADRKE